MPTTKRQPSSVMQPGTLSLHGGAGVSWQGIGAPPSPPWSATMATYAAAARAAGAFCTRPAPGKAQIVSAVTASLVGRKGIG